jgi:hypothetical protein
MLVNTKIIGKYIIQFKADNYAMYAGTYDLQELSEELEEKIYRSFKESNAEIGAIDHMVQSAVVLALSLICIERWSDEIEIEIIED